jgi:hypothetical protein
MWAVGQAVCNVCRVLCVGGPPAPPRNQAASPGCAGCTRGRCPQGQACRRAQPLRLARPVLGAQAAGVQRLNRLLDLRWGGKMGVASSCLTAAALHSRAPSLPASTKHAAAHVWLVEAKVLGSCDGGLGWRRQVLPGLAARLDLCVDALQDLAHTCSVWERGKRGSGVEQGRWRRYPQPGDFESTQLPSPPAQQAQNSPPSSSPCSFWR